MKLTNPLTKSLIAVVAGVITLTSVSALAAVLVQNFLSFDTTVALPPIIKVQGDDANYDGDNDDNTGYLQVKLGEVVSNNDLGLGTPGSVDTLLSNEQISFTCFQGDRTYYTDVLRVENTTASETWDVSLTVEPDILGNAAVSDTFTTGTADIWMFTSEVAPASITEEPNPTNYGALTQWFDSTSPNGAIQLEVDNGTMSAVSTTTGPFTVPAGEQRQIALVVDCGADMTLGETGTFRVTLEATPN